MTKADIIARIYEKVGFSKKEATDVVEATFEIIKGHLEKAKRLRFPDSETSTLTLRAQEKEGIHRPGTRLPSRAVRSLPSSLAKS